MGAQGNMTTDDPDDDQITCWCGATGTYDELFDNAVYGRCCGVAETGFYDPCDGWYRDGMGRANGVTHWMPITLPYTPAASGAGSDAITNEVNQCQNQNARINHP